MQDCTWSQSLSITNTNKAGVIHFSLLKWENNYSFLKTVCTCKAKCNIQITNMFMRSSRSSLLNKSCTFISSGNLQAPHKRAQIYGSGSMPNSVWRIDIKAVLKYVCSANGNQRLWRLWGFLFLHHSSIKLCHYQSTSLNGNENYWSIIESATHHVL